MARILGIRIRNFRVLRDVTLGKLWNTQKVKPLTPLSVVIGKNGVGKSTLFDAFGFLADCLRSGVEEACDMRGRGGFEKLRSKGQNGPIEFEIYYRQDEKSRPITYEIAIDLDEFRRPQVRAERLRQRRDGQKAGRPFSFLLLANGEGRAWKGTKSYTDSETVHEDKELGVINAIMQAIRSIMDSELPNTESVKLTDNRKPGISTLGSFKQHPRISAFREFIEGWYLSYFSPDSARSFPLAGPQKHLNIHGDNLGNVVQFMEREYKEKFKKILDRISKKIPGINKISTLKTQDGRVLLCFNDKGFSDPFYAQQVSNGTLKVFAYLLLLEDPSPPPFLCIEEPENGLYHKLLEVLACEFREHATGRKRSSQIFVTTHQPYFVNSLTPEEVWVLEKQDDGFASLRRASDDPLISNLVSEGIPLGSLWYSDYLDAR